MLDIFNNSLFGIVPLTDAINTPKFQPGRIGSLGIFQESSITSTSVVIEQVAGILRLVPPTPRGGPGVTLDKPKRTGRALRVPHFEINDAIMAEEVQGVRAWGTEDQVQAVQDVVSDRLTLHRQSHEVTIEYQRVGAIKGVIVYADGTTLDLFDEFDVTQDAEIDFDLDNASPTAGALRKKVAQMVRQMGTNLDGVPFTGVTAICGDAFFDDLLANVETRNSYLNNPAAAELRTGYVSQGQVWSSVFMYGVTWENYRGSVGGTNFVETDKAYFFPTGVPSLFRTYFAPADYNETVNRPGQRLYAKQFPMPNDKGVALDTQTNNLNICTRPKALIKGRRT